MKPTHAADQSSSYLDTLDEDLAELCRDLELAAPELLAKASKTTGIPESTIMEILARNSPEEHRK